MLILNLLLAHCALFRAARGAPSDDMRSLSESCENAAAAFNDSLNNTMAMVRYLYWFHFNHGLTKVLEHLGPDPEHYVASRSLESKSRNECV